MPVNCASANVYQCFFHGGIAEYTTLHTKIHYSLRNLFWVFISSMESGLLRLPPLTGLSCTHLTALRLCIRDHNSLQVWHHTWNYSGPFLLIFVRLNQRSAEDLGVLSASLLQSTSATRLTFKPSTSCQKVQRGSPVCIDMS